MDKLRLRFSKCGRAVYISHLDLMRTMQRAFLRAGYPLKYSEGFNPHAQISILLPLSVGMSSRCELMDFALTEEADLKALPDVLTNAMPEGITAIEAYPAERKSRELKWLAVEGKFEYDGYDPDALSSTAEALGRFFARDSIVITRKTKHGEGETDIRPAIRSITVSTQSDCVWVEAVVSAQEPTLNPELLASAVRQLVPELSPDFSCFTRIETFDAEMKIFR